VVRAVQDRAPPGSPGDPASEHRNPAGQYRDSANHTGLHFAQWNSAHNRAGVELSEHPDPRKQHSAFNRQSQPNEYSWHLAQWFALWNLARHGKLSVSLHAEHLEPQSPDSWKSGQHQHVSGDEPHDGTPCPPAASGRTTSAQA
jgi:hypothetical protein